MCVGRCWKLSSQSKQRGWVTICNIELHFLTFSPHCFSKSSICAVTPQLNLRAALQVIHSAISTDSAAVLMFMSALLRRCLSFHALFRTTTSKSQPALTAACRSAPCYCAAPSPQGLLPATHIKALHIPEPLLLPNWNDITPELSLHTSLWHQTHKEHFHQWRYSEKFCLSISIPAVTKGKNKIKYRHREPVASFNFASVQHWDGNGLLPH